MIRVLHILIILFGFGANWDFLKAQEITRLIMSQEKCSTKCIRGYLKEMDTCIFNFEISFKETLPVYSSLIFEVMEASSNFFNDLLTFDMKTDCEGYKENAHFYCTEVDMNAFSITIKATDLSKYSEAKGRFYITTLNGPKIYSDIRTFPMIYESTDAIGQLRINGKNMSSDNLCNTSTKTNDLNIEFDCISEATPCIVQIKINESVVIEQIQNHATYTYIFESNTAVYVQVKFSACRLDGNYNTINCTVTTDFIHSGEHSKTDLPIVLGLSIPAFVLALLIVIFLFVFWLRSKKQSKHPGDDAKEMMLTSIDESPRSLTRSSNINKEGWTALMLAAHKGHKKIVKKLIEMKADLNIQDNQRWTALMLATENGYFDIVKTLIKYGADVNTKESNGWTALMIASQYNGYTKIVKYLIEHKAEVDETDDNKWTALMIASSKGHTRIVDILSRHGAINETTSIKRSLRISKLKEKSSLINNIYTEFSNQEKKEISTDLKKRTRKEWHKRSMENIFGSNRSIPSKSETKDLKIANILKEMNDINKQIKIGLDPIKDTKDVVKSLNALTDNLNKIVSTGWTTLLFACQNNYAEIVKLILHNDKTLVNFSDPMGLTPLMIASQNGHEDIVEMLIQNASELEKCDKRGWTALMHASQHGQNKVIKLLIEKGADRNYKIRDCMSSLNNVEGEDMCGARQEVIDNVVHVTENGRVGWTALMIASQNGHLETVKELISLDADMNAENEDGWTALMIASHNGHVKIAVEIINRQTVSKKT